MVTFAMIVHVLMFCLTTNNSLPSLWKLPHSSRLGYSSTVNNAMSAHHEVTVMQKKRAAFTSSTTRVNLKAYVVNPAIFSWQGKDTNPIQKDIDFLSRRIFVVYLGNTMASWRQSHWRRSPKRSRWNRVTLLTVPVIERSNRFVSAAPNPLPPDPDNVFYIPNGSKKSQFQEYSFLWIIQEPQILEAEAWQIPVPQLKVYTDLTFWQILESQLMIKTYFFQLR